jgi:hypothetical protein
MAAGLGFKDFVTGEVLTAADVDGYLMQGIWVFASAAARDAAVTSPQEGNFAYLKDTNVTTYYTGSAWANLDTTGMTNPMTTTGDTIYSSSGSTPARLGIGSSGQVLTVAAGVPSWATPPGGGGKVLQVVSAQNATNFSTTSTTPQATGLTVSITPTLNTSKVLVLVSLNGIGKYVGGGVSMSVATVILRDSTGVFYGGDRLAYTGSAATNIISQSMNYLDSPATTSATTYKVQYKSMVASQDAVINDYTTSNTTTCSIIALEIGA